MKTLPSLGETMQEIVACAKEWSILVLRITADFLDQQLKSNDWHSDGEEFLGTLSQLLGSWIVPLVSDSEFEDMRPILQKVGEMLPKVKTGKEITAK
eukprot:1312003-Lingulodinium_polyedra.AAC.1